MALEAESDALLLQPPQPPPPPPPPHPLPPSHIIVSPEDRNRDGSLSEMFSLSLEERKEENAKQFWKFLNSSKDHFHPRSSLRVAIVKEQ